MSVTRIWSPADVEKLREAMAMHPAFLGRTTEVEPAELAEVIELDERRRK